MTIENIVRKGENVGYQHFLLFLQYFGGLLSLDYQKSGLSGKELEQSLQFVEVCLMGHLEASSILQIIQFLKQNAFYLLV